MLVVEPDAVISRGAVPMSDLQCAARLVLLCAPGPGTVAGLRQQRVAAVYDGSAEPDGAVAAGLGLPVRVMTRPLAVADVLAHEPVALGDLRDLADLHRGETVVITAVGDRGRRVDVAIDGDGVIVEEVSPGDVT